MLFYEHKKTTKNKDLVQCIFTGIYILWLVLLLIIHRLLDSLVVECRLRVQEVPCSIPSQGPRHTKDVINMVPVVPLFSTQHSNICFIEIFVVQFDTLTTNEISSHLGTGAQFHNQGFTLSVNPINCWSKFKWFAVLC